MLLLSHFLHEAPSCFSQECDDSHRFPMSLRKGSEQGDGLSLELSVGADAGWCGFGAVRPGRGGVGPSSRRSAEGS